MAYGIFRKVTTLEFFQHHFAKSGHGDGLLMTRQLISTFRQPPLHYLTRSVRRTSGFVLADNPAVKQRCAGHAPGGRVLLDKGAQSPITPTRHHAASLVARRGQSAITFDLVLTRALYLERAGSPISLLAAWG